MKKIIIPVALSMLSVTAFSQSWMKGGNNPSANPFILGSNTNDPIGFETNNIQRTRLNGSLVTNLNGVTSQDVSGYFGIAPNGFFSTNTPWSMLHLDGDNNTPYSGNGWRKWMKTGVFMKEHSDAMYVGLKQENGTNIASTVTPLRNQISYGY